MIFCIFSTHRPYRLCVCVCVCVCVWVWVCVCVTISYSKQQERWIRNRFEKRHVPLHKLDTSDVQAWGANVLSPAVASVEALLRGDAEVVPGAVPPLAFIHGSLGGCLEIFPSSWYPLLVVTSLVTPALQ